MSTSPQDADPFEERAEDGVAAAATNDALQSGDTYLDGAYVVFTAQYHLRRGYCCGSGCRHCPYGLHDEVDRKSSTQDG